MWGDIRHPQGAVLNTENLIADAFKTSVVRRRTIVEFWNLTRPDQLDRSELDLFDCRHNDRVNGNTESAFDRRRNDVNRHHTALRRVCVYCRCILRSS